MEKEPQVETVSDNIDFQVSSDGRQTFIEFEAKTPEQAIIGNQAIGAVFTRHQDAGSPTPHIDNSRLGWQRWETWVLSEERARNLIPEIQEEVRNIMELMENNC